MVKEIQFVLFSLITNYILQVESFFAKYPDAGAGARGRMQALETIRGNIVWMTNYQQTISQWLCHQMNTC